MPGYNIQILDETGKQLPNTLGAITVKLRYLALSQLYGKLKIDLNLT